MNNYVKFNNELWQILNINEDGTIKIIKDGYANTSMAFDTAYNRSESYCLNGNNNSINGCNIWSNNTTTLDNDSKHISKMIKVYNNDTTYDLPSKESSINTYLNSTYYDSLNIDAKNMITSETYYVGGLYFTYASGRYFSESSLSISDEVKNVSKYKWIGLVGLIDATEYARTNSNKEKCLTANSNNYDNNSYLKCKNTTWLSSSDYFWWFITPNNNYVDDPSMIWYAGSGGYLGAHNATETYAVRPTLNLKSNLKIKSGTGEKNNPFILE